VYGCFLYGEVVTPSDSVDLDPSPAQALWVGGVGNVAVICEGQGGAITFVAVAAGTLLPVNVKRVMSTNTTSANIVALYA
jgi:hypothetical protein